MIYFFFPETARLSLEEIAKNFGEEVAVNITDATDEEMARVQKNLTEQPPSPTDSGHTQSQNEPVKA